MSTCSDVCIEHDYETDSNEFYAESQPVARREHRCCECGETIHPGQKYQRVSGKADGEMWVSKSCLLCCEIRKAFVCGSWVFGQLWESIEEEMFPVWETSGPIDCLAKLDTLEARNKARERYQQWKSEQS